MLQLPVPSFRYTLLLLLLQLSVYLLLLGVNVILQLHVAVRLCMVGFMPTLPPESLLSVLIVTRTP